MASQTKLTSRRVGTFLYVLAMFFIMSATSSADDRDALEAISRVPHEAPRYVRPTYRASLAAPMPAQIQKKPNSPVFFKESQRHINPHGFLGIYQRGGPVDTRTNAFFKPLGTNGRTCATCHQPTSAMSISTADIRALFRESGGRDPLFAPVDGANCPNSVPAEYTSKALIGNRRGKGNKTLAEAYSLLLSKGLFRIFLPVPKQTIDESAIGNPPHPTEFAIEVVSDPNGCNTDPEYATQTDPVTGEITQIISVYRRPRMSANLLFATTPALTMGLGVFPNVDLVTGLPVVDPVSLQPISGNIMWDGREPTLESQAINATLTHAQALTPPTPQEVQEIVAFETQTFAAQALVFGAGSLTGQDGSPVFGGPRHLADQPVNFAPFSLYDDWLASIDPSTGSKEAIRASIARGQDIFNNRPFIFGNIGGFNNGNALAPALVTPNPFVASCSTCHAIHAGTNPFPATQQAIGTGGQSVHLGGPEPSNDLPIFKLTCRAPYTTPFDGSEVLTNDPGLALITGKCADIGRKTVPQLRGLAARAPYFSDGSAATLRDVVDFYEKRFGPPLSEQERIDLINFLKSL